MKKRNVKNILIKRRYRNYITVAKGQSKSTADRKELAIHKYEICFGDEDFGKFNIDRAISYKKWLKSPDSNVVSLHSVNTYLIHLKEFFTWLSQQPGYRSKVSFDSIQYLNISRKDRRIATDKTLIKFPRIDHIRQLVKSMSSSFNIATTAFSSTFRASERAAVS